MLRKPDGICRYNPPADYPVEGDCVLIVMATPGDLDAVVEAHQGEVVSRPPHPDREG